MSQSTTSRTPASQAVAPPVKPRGTEPPPNKCASCKYWSALTTERDPVTGSCMRYPPGLFPGWNSGGTDDVRAWILPVTGAEHSCGEWTALSEATPSAKSK